MRVSLLCFYFSIINSISNICVAQNDRIEKQIIGTQCDTIMKNGLIYELKGKTIQGDSLKINYSYWDSGKIKSKKILLTSVNYGVFLYSHYFESYENGTLAMDSLYDDRKNNNKIILTFEFYPNSNIKRTLKSIGKIVKGRGVGETFSWGVNWVTTRKFYNEIGELTREESVKNYHR